MKMLAEHARPIELKDLAGRIAAARRERGWTQAILAARCGLERQQITFFERGTRLPGLDQLLEIARALDLPLQRFLGSADTPGWGAREIAIELRHLGLVDLWVDRPIVPGAFRRPEEVVALALAGAEPEARIVDGIPAVLAWNGWSAVLLRAFARTTRPAATCRIAWLADIALALERSGGFPGGCAGKEDLAAFLESVRLPTSARWDSLGKPSRRRPASPLWKRWHINYAADLSTFRKRAEALVALREAEGQTQRVHRD